MHRIGIDFKATLPQMALGLLGGVLVMRYVVRPKKTFTGEHPRPAARVEADAGGAGAPSSSSSSSLAPPTTTPGGGASSAAAGGGTPASAVAPSAPRTLRVELDGPLALDALGRGLTLLLITRGYPPREAAQARAALDEAQRRLDGGEGEGEGDGVREGVGRRRQLLCAEVSDHSSAAEADKLVARLGLSHPHPFVVLLDAFLETEKKYLSPVRAVPAAGDVLDLVRKHAAGALSPARLGQPRPPKDSATPSCPELVEIVTESFGPIVLDDPRTHVLVECYTRRCDACKAFAPRYRMLAALCARRFPGVPLKIAAMDILDNDRDPAHLPEKWTPSLRLFPAAVGGTPGARTKRAKDGSCASVLMDTTAAGPSSSSSSEGAGAGTGAGTGAGAGAGAAGSATSAAVVDAGASATRVFLPTLPELLAFLEEHTGGAIRVTPDILAEAEALESDAAALEACYDAALRYMSLWQRYSSALGEARREMVAVREGLERRKRGRRNAAGVGGGSAAAGSSGASGGQDKGRSVEGEEEEDDAAAAAELEEEELEEAERARELEEAQKAADGLRSKVTAAYKFLLEEAGGSVLRARRGSAGEEGGGRSGKGQQGEDGGDGEDGGESGEDVSGLQTALGLLDAVADHVTRFDMTRVVADAEAVGQEAAAGAAGGAHGKME